MSHLDDIDDSLLESSEDNMSQRPGQSKPAPKANPNQQRTRSQAQGASTARAPEPEKRKADETPMDAASSAKIPSLRDQLTSAYETRVAVTKATRDPRLWKGNRTHPIHLPKPEIKTIKHTKTLKTHNTYLNYYTYLLPTILANAAPELEIVPEAKEVDLPTPSTAKPTSFMQAPVLNLKDFLPEGVDCPDQHDKALDSSFRATRLEFIILQREDEEDQVSLDDDDDDQEWTIPDQETFNEVVADAVFHFTEKDSDRSVRFSKKIDKNNKSLYIYCLLYTSPSPRD